MPATNSNCPPTCPGCPECESGTTVCVGDVPSCKAMSPGSICECELLYLAAINGELLASDAQIRALYNDLADYYLRSSERGCGRSR
jgi:hypothetical protein